MPSLPMDYWALMNSPANMESNTPNSERDGKLRSRIAALRTRLKARFSRSPESLSEDVMHKNLQQCMADARYLIAFTVSEGRKLEPGLIDKLVQAISGLDKDKETLDAAKETAFWAAYHQLTTALSPITAESARESAEMNIANKATGWHTYIAFAAFIALAGLQAMWVTGTNLYADLEKADALVDAQSKAIVDIHARQVRLNLQGAPIADQHAVDSENRVASDAYSELVRNREPLVELIEGWYGWMSLQRWPISEAANVLELQKTLKQAEEDHAKAEATAMTPQESREAAIMEAHVNDLTGKLKAAQVRKAIEIKQRVKLILDDMQRYLFPILLGLLGALTYILRSVSVAVGNFTYTRNDRRLSSVRIYLGTMAGLLGGMLIPPGTEGVLKNLSPLALSFLLGYAVEILFTFMDRLVAAFSSEKVAK